MGEPRLAGQPSEVGELGTSPGHRDTPSQVTGTAHDIIALGHAGGPCPGLGPPLEVGWTQRGHLKK